MSETNDVLTTLNAYIDHVITNQMIDGHDDSHLDFDYVITLRDELLRLRSSVKDNDEVIAAQTALIQKQSIDNDRLNVAIVASAEQFKEYVKHSTENQSNEAERLKTCDQCGGQRTMHPSGNFWECLPCHQRDARLRKIEEAILEYRSKMFNWLRNPNDEVADRERTQAAQGLDDALAGEETK